MQELLPISLRRSADKKVTSVVIELCSFFRVLCSKVLKFEELELLVEKIAQTMSNMETIFLSSFFTIMVHLVIHLAIEVKIAGPVQHRWMYPIERYLRTFKLYVRNLSCPEGSIAEAYITNECLQFCSQYVKGEDSRSYWSRKNKDDTEHEVDKEGCLFRTIGKSYGLVEIFKLDKKHGCKHIDMCFSIVSQMWSTIIKSPLEARKIRGPTLLKDIWNLPSGKAIVVPFNSHNKQLKKKVESLLAF